MPTGTRFKTGNSATITLAGTLTTGVSTAWVGNIKSINPGEWTIGERAVDLLLDTGFMRVDPHDLAVPNEVSGVNLFSPVVGVPSVNGNGVLGSSNNAGFHLAQQPKTWSIIILSENGERI